MMKILTLCVVVLYVIDRVATVPAITTTPRPPNREKLVVILLDGYDH